MLKGKSLAVILILLVVFVLLIAFVFTTVPAAKRWLPFTDVNPLPETSAQNVSLEYWGMYEPSPVMEQLISEYNKSHPGVKITYVDRNFEDDLVRYKETLLTRLKNGNGPHIFRVHSTWIPEYIREVSLDNNSLRLEEFRERFYPVAETQCVTTDGKVMCVPLMYDGLALFYNKELFNALGIGEPETWDEVRDAAFRLTQKNNNEILVSGLAIGTAENVTYSTDILGLMFFQSGVVIPDGIDTDAASAALTFYTNFSKSDQIWNSTLPESITAFAAQKAAMVFGTSRDIERILEINPTLQIGVLPVPQLPDISGGVTTDTWASFWVESVSIDANSAEQKAAWDFLEWLSRPEQQKFLYSETGKIKRVPTIPANREVQGEVEKNPYLANIIRSAVYSKTHIIADNAGNNKYSEVIKEAISRVAGEGFRSEDPKESLETAKKEYSDLLK